MRRMIRLLVAFLTLVASPALAADPADGLQPKFTAASKFVPARTVQVWLPPDYARSNHRYPVIYLHDGQNVYDDPSPWSGKSWAAHRALAKLVAEKKVRPAILVAVWNTDNRIGEYMPQAAVPEAGFKGDPAADDLFRKLPVERAKIAGDAYLAFLVTELKPLIDKQYRTLRGPRDTMLMGSSMGGLISAYALVRYPTVFGAAACLSTAWPIGDGFTERWFETHLPSGRLYFDYGTGTNDGAIEPFQARVDATAGNRGGRWVSRAFPGAEHSERAWAARVDIPLTFLLAKR
ncbi:MAG: alpha/beta hydrolase [Sphingomonas bacterium]|jgi:predicted alpha/beta superfamily hydrolase|nr:alpha/beta hydrolase [Sphingomonas bacterium]